MEQVTIKYRISDNLFSEIVDIQVGEFDSENYPNVIQSNEFTKTMEMHSFVDMIKNNLIYSEIVIK
jgi:hypothetical protein